MQDLSALQRENLVEALAVSGARIGELERDAVDRRGDADENTRLHLERYRALVLAIAQVVWTRDSVGDMVVEQPSWAAYTGQSFGQYVGLGWLDAVHPDDRTATVLAWERAMATQAPYEIEHRLRRHDGEYRYFSVRAVTVLDDEGVVVEWAGIHTDITERKLTEQTLRDGARRFRELADSMPQIVWEADPAGRFDYYNRRWYEFTGRPQGIRGDESWTDVVHPDDQKECLERWHSATRTGDAYEIEYRLREKTGVYHWFLRRALPVRDHEGRITRWHGTCTNIDAVKHTEAVLRSANFDADASNRELEAFSYSVAHDLRSPLRAIDGFSQAILEDNADRLDAEGKENLARVRAAAQRMGHLIDSLLSLSRVSRTEVHRERMSLTDAARAVASRLQDANADRDVDFVVEDGLTVDADANLMVAVMENLLGNAWKFTSHQPKARIEVGLASKDGQPAYFVRDDGAGFEMAYASKLFGAFQRLHGEAEFPGTGIGLATVHRIIRRHGGQTWAEGHVGRGATFFFTLSRKAET